MVNLSSDVENVCRLTPMQEGMLFHNLFSSKSTYVIQNIMELTGIIDEEKLIKSFWGLTKIHEILRSVILYEGVKNPLLVFPKDRKPEITILEYEGEEEFRRFIEADKQRGFDMEKDTLFRVNLFKLSDRYYYMVITYSHIIVDGWSYSIIMNDLNRIYTRLCQGMQEDQIIDELKSTRDRLKYSHYANWIGQQDMESALKYWSTYLEGYCNSVGIIPIDIEKEGADTYKTVKLQLSKNIADKMYKLCQSLKITPNTFMETAWGLTLQAYNNVQDVVFGKVVMGRNNALHGIMDMVGLCINTIPIRVVSEDAETIMGVLKKQHQKALEVIKYDFCSLVDILSCSGMNSEVIQTLFIFENLHDEDRLCLEESSLEIKDVETIQETNYDISIYAQADQTLLLINRYNARKYSDSQMNLLMQRYQYILMQILENPLVKVNELKILLPCEEKESVLHKFNEKYEGEDELVPLQNMFMESVLKNLNHVALVYKDIEMTYGELDCLSTNVAKNLVALGVNRGDFVAVIAKRGLDMFAAIYGILKAGAAYIPIDFNYPEERMEYILDNANCEYAVVTDYKELKTDKKQILVKELYKDRKEMILSTDYALSDIAYLIYTSGTTGKPNGVIVTNKNIVNYCSQHPRNVYGGIIKEDNRTIACITTISFDIFVTEIFLSLLNGMKVVVASETEQNEGGAFCEFLEHYQVDTLQITPSRMKLVLQSEKADRLNGVKTIFLGGEPLTAELCKNIRKKTDADLYNIYGPSETTVWSVYGKVDSMEYTGNVPIGKPIRNTKVFIRNRNHKLCGIGMLGEICIQGSGVTNGYLNNKGITDEKFYSNEWNSERTYCTGDLGYWMQDGRLQCIGRMDDQAKIRGIRIEPEEIEKLILENCSAIQDVKVVVRKKDEQDYLCAYYVSEDEIDVWGLRKSMHKKIHPAVFPLLFRLDKLPTNMNGKFDKKQLPAFKIHPGEYIEPKNEIETELLGMFEEVLGVKNIGVKDDFFALGGHSLKMMALINMIQMKYEIKMTIKEVFYNSTVRDIGKLIREGEGEKEENIVSVTSDDSYGKVTKIQEGIYISCMINEDGIDYNMPQCYCVDGEIKVDKLNRAFVKVVDRYEILRTNFTLLEDGVASIIAKKLNPVVGCTYCESIEEEYHRFIKPFDLEKDLLIRMEIVETKEKQYLLVDAHHIILDGISFGLLIEELSAYYNELDGRENIIQFREYCDWINSKDLKKQEMYWLSHLKGNIIPLTLKCAKKRPEKRGIDGNVVSVSFARQEIEGIEEFLKANKVTEYMLFLSAFYILLRKNAKQDCLTIGTNISGRTDAKFEKMIGMLANTVVIQETIPEDMETAELLESVRRHVLETFENQDLPYESLVESMDMERDISRTPLFDVLFSFHRQEHRELDFKEFILEPVELGITNVKFDLDFNVTIIEDTYYIDAEYSIAIFEEEAIRNLVNEYKDILFSVVKGKYIRICDFLKHGEKDTSNEMEEVLKEILNVKEIKPDDDFFELGGDSIKAMRIVAKMKRKGYSIKIKDIIQKRKISLIMQCGNREGKNGQATRDDKEDKEIFYTPIIYNFLNNWQMKYRNYFNQAVMLKTETFVDEILEKTLDILCHNHDIFHYRIAGNQLTYAKQERLYTLRSFTIDETKSVDEQMIRECNAEYEEMDAEQGPIVRCVRFQMVFEEQLLICIHHIAVDEVSWRILVDEFKSIYNQILNGHQVEDVLKESMSFSQWSRILQEYGRSQDLMEEYDYWNKVVSHIEKKM